MQHPHASTTTFNNSNKRRMQQQEQQPQPRHPYTSSLTRRGVRRGRPLPAWRCRSVGVHPLRGGLPDRVPKNVDFFLHYGARAIVPENLKEKKIRKTRSRRKEKHKLKLYA